VSALPEILPTIPFLRDAPADARDELDRMAVCHDYPKGNILFYDGERCDTVYIVLDGRVKISLISEEGREVILAGIRPTGLFGLVASIEGHGAHIGTAATVTHCRLAKIPVEGFNAWLGRHPDLQRPLLSELARMLREAYQKIGIHSLLPVKQRLLSTLVDIATADGEPGREGEIVFVRPTHQELADMVGTTRVVVSRLLKELVEEDEAIESSGKVMRVSVQKVLRDDEL